MKKIIRKKKKSTTNKNPDEEENSKKKKQEDDQETEKKNKDKDKEDKKKDKDKEDKLIVLSLESDEFISILPLIISSECFKKVMTIELDNKRLIDKFTFNDTKIIDYNFRDMT